MALADKLDTLVGFFAIDEKPTGSRDPYRPAPRGAGVIRILEADLRAGLRAPRVHAARPRGRDLPSGGASTTASLSRSRAPFFADRLKVLLREQGQRHDLVDAVFALGDDDMVRIVAKVEALDGFLATEDGANLLAGYKRAVNILKAEEKKGPLPTGMATPACPTSPRPRPPWPSPPPPRDPRGRGAGDRGLRSRHARARLLRAPVDAFFTGVMVNSDVAEERENRLNRTDKLDRHGPGGGLRTDRGLTYPSPRGEGGGGAVG